MGAQNRGTRVRIERLHKNIVEHKYGQYRSWLDKQEVNRTKESDSNNQEISKEGGSGTEKMSKEAEIETTDKVIEEELEAKGSGDDTNEEESNKEKLLKSVGKTPEIQ